MINKQEIKYILYSGIFAFVWFLLVLPQVVKFFDGKNPYLQFLLFNVGISIFFFLFLKSITTSTSLNIKSSLGLLLLVMSLDTLLPDYHVGFNGELIIGTTLGASTSDYFFGSIAHQFGLSGFLVYGFVYLIMPIILLFISSKLLPNFVRNI